MIHSLIRLGESHPYVSVLLSVVIFGAIILVRRPALTAKAPALVRENYPIVGAIEFWTRRFEFYLHQQSKSPTGNFSFFLGKNPVVGLGSDEGRKVFFESRGLGVNEGYDSSITVAPLTLSDIPFSSVLQSQRCV